MLRDGFTTVTRQTWKQLDVYLNNVWSIFRKYFRAFGTQVFNIKLRSFPWFGVLLKWKFKLTCKNGEALFLVISSIYLWVIGFLILQMFCPTISASISLRLWSGGKINGKRAKTSDGGPGEMNRKSPEPMSHRMCLGGEQERNTEFSGHRRHSTRLDLQERWFACFILMKHT